VRYSGFSGRHWLELFTISDSDVSLAGLALTITQSGGTVNVRSNGATEGTYFITIKYNSKSLNGQSAPSPTTTVHYDFMTTACLLRSLGSIS
jgi:hypothetical protein